MKQANTNYMPIKDFDNGINNKNEAYRLFFFVINEILR